MKSKNYSENIIKVFKKDGFVLSEPDVLLDSNYIIERSGENFRKIMLTFEDDTGKSMCLRPDLTVASCIKYLKDNSKGNSKIYYSGQAYRRSKSLKKVVNYQLGLEIFGSKNKSSDDLKVLKTITNSINKIKIKNISIKVGDVSLFKQLIDSLKIPERWRMRLKRHFWRPQYFEVFKGISAKQLGILITEERNDLITRFDHALYLGRELQKAEECLYKKLPYIQD